MDTAPAARGGRAARPAPAEPLRDGAVPVVLDGEVCSPGELGGDDGPAVRSNGNQSSIRLVKEAQ